MPDQEEARHIADGRGTRTNKPLDSEQRLVLLRRQSLPLRRHLAEREKDTQLIAELCQRLVINSGGGFIGLSLSAIWPRDRSTGSLELRHPPFSAVLYRRANLSSATWACHPISKTNPSSLNRFE